MSTDDVMQLSHRRLVLTVAETMRTLNMGEDAAIAALDAVHAAFPTETQPLYVILTAAPQGRSFTSTLCIGDNEADSVLGEATAMSHSAAHKRLYGLQRVSALKATTATTTVAAVPKAATVPRTTPCLRVANTPQLRAYPLVSREALERGDAAKPTGAVMATPLPAAAAATPTKPEVVKVEVKLPSVKLEPSSARAATPTLSVAAPSIAASPPTMMPFAPSVKAEPSTTSTARTEDVLELGATTGTPLTQSDPPQATKTATSAPTATPQRRQSSLFETMMGSKASATADSEAAAVAKRGRTASPQVNSTTSGSGTAASSASSASVAPATKKKKVDTAGTRTVAKKKEAPTRSLAKLAKASAKATTSSTSSKAAPTFDFDEEASQSEQDEADEHESVTFLSHEAFNEEAEAEPTAALDVEVTAVNDDIILYDNTTPLAFQEPARVLPNTTPPLTKTAASAGASEGGQGHSQRSLSTFFNPAVVALQSQYAKEVQTDMRLEEDEYICVDVICYRNKATGEIISEEAFHKLTSEIVERQAMEAASGEKSSSPSESPQKAAGGEDASPSSSSEAAVSAKRGHKMKVAKQVVKDVSNQAPAAKPTPAPTKNLLSFFKQ